MKKEVLILALLLPVLPLTAQPQRLTLDDCREMALKADKDLQQARTRIEMAGYDRKIALANYFPSVSATGAYLYNNRDIALVSDDQSERIRTMGSTIDEKIWDRAELNASERGKAILEALRTSGAMPDIATPEIGRASCRERV